MGYRNIRFLAIYDNIFKKDGDSYLEIHARSEIQGFHDVPHKILYNLAF